MSSPADRTRFLLPRFGASLPFLDGRLSPFGGRKPSSLAETRRLEWKRASGARPRVYGHRGARHAEPENTLRAFEAAMAEGADGIELDVRLTADGVPVIAHDERLPSGARDSRGPFEEKAPKLSELSASQVEAIRLPSGERIPTLREALGFRNDTGAFVNVELKSDLPAREKLVRVACDAFERLGGERILVSSFDPRIVREVALRCPDIPVAWLVHSGQRVLRFAPGWQLLGAVGVNPQVTEPLERIARFSEQGAIVNVWTVNDEERALALARAGVDGLITDAPRKILDALARAES